MKRMRSWKDTKAGFTVMETIMGFAILMLSLSGFSGMVVSSLRSFRASQDKYLAAKIAQEGIELTTNKKDNHVQCMKSDPGCTLSTWQDNLAPVAGVGSFEVESGRYSELRPQNQFGSFSNTRVICLKKAPPTDYGKFGYCPDSSYILRNLSQSYTREVQISRLGANAVLVKSIVNWKGGKNLTLETVLFSR